MRNDFCSNYLAHHGIKGQKWGVRNGPPYPLDSSQKPYRVSKENLINTGKKAAEPYMNMNLQSFANYQKPYNFKSKEEYARVMSVLRNNLSDDEKKMPRLVKDIQSDEKHNGAYHYHCVNQDGNGNFTVVKRTKIKDAGTGVLERNSYESKPKKT